MATTFRKGQKVRYFSAITGDSGTGKIVDIHPTRRGDWYQIKDDEDAKRKIKRRAAQLEAL